MSRSVLSCSLQTPAREAARRMAEHHVSALIAVEEKSGDLEGIISRTDLARVYDKDVDSLTVEMVMSHRVETIVPDIPVSTAVLIMVDHNVDGGPQCGPAGHHARKAGPAAIRGGPLAD